MPRPKKVDLNLPVMSDSCHNWLLASFLAPPVILFLTVFLRVHWAFIPIAFITGIGLSFFAFVGYVECAWSTDPALIDRTDDTGRLFGPVIIGIPLAVGNATISLTLFMAIKFCIRRVASKLRNKRTKSEHHAAPPKPAKQLPDSRKLN